MRGGGDGRSPLDRQYRTDRECRVHHQSYRSLTVSQTALRKSETTRLDRVGGKVELVLKSVSDVSDVSDLHDCDSVIVEHGGDIFGRKFVGRV